MKQLNTLLFILFAVYLLGNFANYAQNDYSAYPIFWSTFFIAITSLIATVILVRKCFKEKWTSGIRIPVIALVIICGFVFMALDQEIVAISILFAALGTMIAECIWANVSNWKNEETSNRFLALEYFSIFTIFTGVFLKTMHWPGAAPLMIFGSFSILFLNLPWAFRVLTFRFRTERWLSICSFLLHINMILGALFYIFKVQHYPGSSFMMWTAIWVLGILGISVLISLRLKRNDVGLSFRRRLFNKKSSFLFLFIYTNYFVLYIFLQAIHIGPKAYNAKLPPAFQKLNDENHYNRGEIYFRNYASFLENRSVSENY
jgi:hypothetical protein